MRDYELEKGSKKYRCPNCGASKKFVREVNRITGEYAPSEFGRCERVGSCGYERYMPSESSKKKPDARRQVPRKENVLQAISEAKILPAKPDFIPFELFKRTLDDYDRNAFVQFLLNLFPDSVEEIQNVLGLYSVGTFDDYTCFPYIDRSSRICKGKLIRFNSATGKRRKGEFDTSSLPAKLKLKKDFQYKQIFFGEHLLTTRPGSTVAIVEAEKSAIIASLCMPEFTWLASGSKQWLKPERLERLGSRKIILYPDADGFNQWRETAIAARKIGLTVNVSDLIEKQATDAEKLEGYDLADYLISEQKQINEFNARADSYNLKLRKVLSNEKLFEKFNRALDREKANLMLYTGLPAIEAEIKVSQFENVRKLVVALTEKQSADVF